MVVDLTRLSSKTDEIILHSGQNKKQNKIQRYSKNRNSILIEEKKKKNIENFARKCVHFQLDTIILVRLNPDGFFFFPFILLGIIQ